MSARHAFQKGFKIPRKQVPISLDCSLALLYNHLGFCYAAPDSSSCPIGICHMRWCAYSLISSFINVRGHEVNSKSLHSFCLSRRSQGDAVHIVQTYAGSSSDVRRLMLGMGLGENRAEVVEGARRAWRKRSSTVEPRETCWPGGGGTGVLGCRGIPSVPSG